MEAEIFSYKEWISCTDENVLKHTLADILEMAEFEILNFTSHNFTPVGYTAVWLLGESHLAIHTFPEKKKTYLELSSCNASKNEDFKRILKTSGLL